MKNLITLDFETYYDKEYSLSKMTTEEYIRNKRFQVIGLGIKVEDKPAMWVPNHDGKVGKVLKKIPFRKYKVLAHNTRFDGAILAWRYGVNPSMWLDTLSMSRPVTGNTKVGGSLAKLAEHFKIGTKGKEVVHAMGMRLEDFSPAELARYGQYCINDTELCYKLFFQLGAYFPDMMELRAIDATTRMYTEPRIELNTQKLKLALEVEHLRREAVLKKLTAKIPPDTLRDMLRKKETFAKLLKSLGVALPYKPSPANPDKFIYAFAKTDQGMRDLLDHPNPKVQMLAECKLEVSSSVMQTRLQRFLDISYRGLLPVPINYWAAHTGRDGGADKINMQNLPRDSALRHVMQAPKGHKLVVADLSQIEARLLATCAGQWDLVEQFKAGMDPYCEFASKIYGKQITKADKIERFIGKTSVLGLGYGVGAQKFHGTLTSGGMGMVVNISEHEAKRVVDLYRSTFTDISGAGDRNRGLWNTCKRALSSMVAGRDGALTKEPNVEFVPDGLILPNRMRIFYPNLRQEAKEFHYDSRKGPVKLYGAKMVENLIQALARIVIFEYMDKLNMRFPCVLRVHDELVYVVPDGYVKEFVAHVNKVMSTPPKWLGTLPVACEVGVGETYGGAK